jgi:hypothetical protein
MVSSSRARRAVAAAVLAAAVASIGAASAQAKTVTVTDDTAADFAQGTPAGTVVGTAGAVEIARTLNEQFDGAGLPTGWTANPVGTATAQDLSLVVDGGIADSNQSAGPGSSLEFRATLGSQAFTHVGFGTLFTDEAWAIFSTGPDIDGKLYARLSTGPGTADDQNFLVDGVDARQPQDYRIDWNDNGFDFYVNGELKITHGGAVAAGMRALASNISDGDILKVDFIAMGPRAGKFTSRTMDAGDARVTGVSFAGSSIMPAGTAITYETRTAVTPDGFVEDWQALSNGAVASPPRRYLQYRATLTTPGPAVTPRLDTVDVGFTIEDDPPSAPPSSPVTPPTSNPPGSNPVNLSGDAPDGTKPEVLVMGRSARVSKSGVAKLRVRCPRSEQTCDVAVKLKLRGKRIASKSKTLPSGATGTFRLKLSTSARIKLAARSSLSATAVVSAEDAAGNRRKTKHKVTLLAPGR